jgi:hypothetical protein
MHYVLSFAIIAQNSLSHVVEELVVTAHDDFKRPRLARQDSDHNFFVIVSSKSSQTSSMLFRGLSGRSSMSGRPCDSGGTLELTEDVGVSSTSYAASAVYGAQRKRTFFLAKAELNSTVLATMTVCYTVAWVVTTPA